METRSVTIFGGGERTLVATVREIFSDVSFILVGALKAGCSPQRRPQVGAACVSYQRQWNWQRMSIVMQFFCDPLVVSIPSEDVFCTGSDDRSETVTQYISL